MSQLQKKSFVAAAAGHFLLLAVLLIGPAFFVARHESDDVSKGKANDSTLTILPTEQVEKALGEPERAQPAPPAPRANQPAVSQPPARKSPKLPRVESANPVFRNQGVHPPPHSATSNSEVTANLKKEVNSTLQSLRKQLSPESPTGPINSGGGSEVDYATFVEAIYDNAWLAADDVADENASVKVSVTILRNGTVAASRILNRSGIPALDTSVVRLLDRVKTIGRPFPDGDREAQRTFIINFNLKNQRPW